jgi:hypothetical protein
MRRRVCSIANRAVAKISRSRIGSKSRYDFPFSIKNFRENSGHHQLRFVSRISASSFDAACPLSMLSRAFAAALWKSFATFARHNAAAAFMTTRSRGRSKIRILVRHPKLRGSLARFQTGSRGIE